MSMLRALSAMGSLAGGVMEGLDDNERRAKRKKLEDQQGELQALQLENLKTQAQDQRDLRQAVAPVTAEVNTPGDGMGPSATMVNVGGQKTAYGTAPEQVSQATTMAQAMNTPEARTKRRDEVLMRAPDGEERVMKLNEQRRNYAKAIETEGAMDFVGQNFQMAPNVADIEGGKASLFQLNGVEGFNKTGKLKIPEGAMGKWQVLDLGNGRKVADFTVVDATGKPLSTMTGRTLEAIHGMSLKEREALADKRASDGRDYELKKGEAEARGQYLRGLVSNGAARVDAGQDLKIPDAVKLTVSGLDNQIQAISKQLEMATPEAASGLNEQLAGLSIQRRKLLTPYMNQQGGAPDPLGLGAVSPAPAPVGNRAPASAPAGSGRSPDSDRAMILNAELQKAKQARDAAAPGSDAWIRADADMKSVARELGQKPASAPAPGKPKAAPTKAASAPQAPTKAASTPSMLDAATEWLGSTGKDYSTPQGKQELQRRVKESKQGGKPLTKTETLRAQQAGLI